MATPFTHAIVDDMGDIIRKYRWSAREAKGYKETNHNAIVIKLNEVKEVKEVKADVFSLVGECLF